MSGAGVRIGLEVHVYLRTRAKLFCACSADALAAPRANANVCPTCTGQPGAKPMAPNAAAFALAARIAHALGATPRPVVRVLRKHYFYPDLASNYQRTSEPIAEGGTLAGARIRELHVEEDPGAYDPETGLVDYDRSGLPLVEIVTEPDLASPAHARRFLNELRLVLSYLDAWRAEAGMKADCNVSVHGGERAEVKNVNSVRNVERALEHEVARQLDAHGRGERQARETRHFDEATGRTTRLRAKESEADYRYVPDPDFPPVAVPRAPVEEPPLARRARIAALVGVAEEDASPLLEERALADSFDRAAARASPQAAFAFLVRDVRAELEFRKLRLADARVTQEELADLVAALDAKRVTPHVATRLLREGFGAGDLAAALARETTQAGPADGALSAAVRQALDANPKAVADWRTGKATAVNFLVGQAMKALRGRADANELRRLVEDALTQER